MEYMITTERPFEEVESLTMAALERQGFLLQRTFSLHSATRAASTDENPGYSVFMVRGKGANRQPLGFLTLYESREGMVVKPMLTSAADVDVHGDLVAALVASGLALCVDGAGTEGCIDLKGTDEELAPNDNQV